MAIPILENASRVWDRLLLREESYSLVDHEGTWGVAKTVWNQIGNDDELGVDRYELMEECLKAYRKDPRAHNIIEIYASHIIGDGYYAKFENDSDNEAWKAFCDENRFPEKFKEIVRLALIKGNHFLWVFDGQVAKVRHLDASNVGEIEVGVEDAEEVLGYKGRVDYADKRWGADELIHFCVGKMGNYPWGLPLLEPILPSLTRKRKYENAQSLLLRILVSIPILRQGPWTGEQIVSRRDDIPTMPAPGTIVHDSDKVTYSSIDHPGWRVNWRDQGKSLDLAIAAGVGLPYYMVHSDTSDSSYASALVSESPAMRHFEDLREDFEVAVTRLIERVIAPDGGFEFHFKPLERRDTEQEVKPWTPVYALGAISHQTYLEKIGVDVEKEMERLAQEGRMGPEGEPQPRFPEKALRFDNPADQAADNSVRRAQRDAGLPG